MKIYDKIGDTYTAERRPDPRIEAMIHNKLSRSNTVLNIGAGTGSYEPKEKSVIALDPSMHMLRNRPSGSAPCLIGGAEALPFKNAAFDSAMAILTMHHWSNWKVGLQEALRICKYQVVIVTWDPEHEGFWLTRDYLKEIHAVDSKKFPSIGILQRVFSDISIEPLLIPWDCRDGFMGAYWQRPESYLDESKRKSISSLALNSSIEGLEKLRNDLFDGSWEKKYGYLRNETELDIGYRLVIIGKGTS